MQRADHAAARICLMQAGKDAKLGDFIPYPIITEEEKIKAAPVGTDQDIIGMMGVKPNKKKIKPLDQKRVKPNKEKPKKIQLPNHAIELIKQRQIEIAKGKK